jgi:hypothetical protein
MLADIYLSALWPRHIRLHRNLRPLEFRRDDRELLIGVNEERWKETAAAAI